VNLSFVSPSGKLLNKETNKILEIVYRSEALSHVSLRILEKGT